MGAFTNSFTRAFGVQQGADENLDDVLFFTNPDDGLNYDLTFTDVDTNDYYLQLIEE